MLKRRWKLKPQTAESKQQKFWSRLKISFTFLSGCDFCGWHKTRKNKNLIIGGIKSTTTTTKKPRRRQEILKFKSHANIFSRWLMVFVIRSLQGIGLIGSLASSSWCLIKQRLSCFLIHARDHQNKYHVHVLRFWGDLELLQFLIGHFFAAPKMKSRKKRNAKWEEIYNAANV